MAYILFCFILEKAKTLIIQNPWYNKVYSCENDFCSFLHKKLIRF